MPRAGRPALAAALVGVLAAAFASAAQFGRAQSTGQTPPVPSAPTDLVARGRYLTAAGDCEACHTVAGGAPFAGGRSIPTPFGVLLSANITPAGIGDWTPDQFYRALHLGIDDEGKHLYPAFPYNYYTRVTRADSDAIFAYLKTVPPVANHPDRDQLNFPFNIRALMIFWNWMFLRPGTYQAHPDKSAEWNRGAYLVEGLGHCGACHTPSNFMGAPQQSHYLQGGAFGDWFAPDLTMNPRKGVGAWSRQDLIEFLKTGRNVHAAAAGEMGEVVQFSTSQLTDADLNAIVTYIQDRPASPTPAPRAPDAAQLRQGEAIFVDSCSACHGMRGEGVPRFFPPLAGDANLQQTNPATTLNFILTGVQSAPTGARPTGLAMPAYAWKLSDSEIAAVATYVRNAWGNSAPAVTASQVAGRRRKVVVAGSQVARPLHNYDLSKPNPETYVRPLTSSLDNGGPNAGGASGQGGAGGNGKGSVGDSGSQGQAPEATQGPG